MSDARLSAEPDRYLQAAALNSVPPPVPSDPLADGVTPVEQLLRVLGLAANADDAGDGAAGAEGYAQREAWTAEAARTFPGQDGAAAGQIASGVAGALAGIMAPLTQLPQQFTQGAQQVVQAATSLTGRGTPPDPITDPNSDADTAQDPDPDAVDLGAEAAAAADAGSPGSTPTAPSAVLSPAVVASPATHPSASSAPAQARTLPTLPALAPAPGMTGMPMMPPAAVSAAGTSAADSKAETKRVSVPSVRNGAAVQGRIGVTGPVVTTSTDGKPAASRRAPTVEPG